MLKLAPTGSFFFLRTRNYKMSLPKRVIANINDNLELFGNEVEKVYTAHSYVTNKVEPFNKNNFSLNVAKTSIFSWLIGYIESIVKNLQELSTYGIDIEFIAKFSINDIKFRDSDSYLLVTRYHQKNYERYQKDIQETLNQSFFIINKDSCNYLYNTIEQLDWAKRQVNLLMEKPLSDRDSYTELDSSDLRLEINYTNKLSRYKVIELGFGDLLKSNKVNEELTDLLQKLKDNNLKLDSHYKTTNKILASSFIESYYLNMFELLEEDFFYYSNDALYNPETNNSKYLDINLIESSVDNSLLELLRKFGIFKKDNPDRYHDYSVFLSLYVVKKYFNKIINANNFEFIDKLSLGLPMFIKAYIENYIPSER